MGLFDNIKSDYKIDKPVRLIELFAGYGSQALALKYLNVKFEHHFVCEFDKYAVQSYNEIHNTAFNPSDVCKIKAQDLNIVDRDRYIYILTYSFPCQDLSLAGKQKGMEKGSNTRSGLLWEVERLLKECKGELPHVLLMENVPQVIGSKNIKDFNEWTLFLESLGYKNYCEILNAKDYGIPQNRERCFMISILGDYNYTFPQKIPLKLRLKDMLEDNVDEKFYLSDKKIEKVKSWGGYEDPLKDTSRDRICKTLTTHCGKDSNGMVLVEEKEIIPYGNYYTWKDKQGNINTQCNRAANENKCALTVACANTDMVYENNLRIRKLTPRECFRLMGVKDEDSDKITCSNNQKYKQAGNSIVVDVLMAIFKQLF